MAEMLGVKLDIPPEFWLAHCDQTCRFNPVDGIRNRQGRSKYWRVLVPQVREAPLMVEQEDAECVIEVGAFDRFNVVLPKNVALGSIKFYGLVSFWGMTHGEDGWTRELPDPQTCSSSVSNDTLVESSSLWIPGRRAFES
ncbi:uncharacterized protein BDZ83DRAFT_640652 [Colletotrichum acutatum]|uniref:Uncharacterized protein n=1 Tax=Glomerella acutata TaxID=27357 RepID=A0AAD8U9X5_GLOAC|nr:uncharacterized protein BDZ83DRAFT_640652 [Colletotrichum acutatum]KAK1710298.1 hypothetical protein BDZ83DRAFT_640652 [Colletotrichum acutatum]